MSARSALPNGYRRPTDATLDHLVDTGTGSTSDPSGNSDVAGASSTPGTAGTRGTKGDPGTQRTGGTSSTADTTDVSGTSAKKVEPRDHVKVRRGLADEMRDAVWFLSEHGRPRVQLGELLDEALAAWLAEAKAKHNGGEDFPRRGRLR